MYNFTTNHLKQEKTLPPLEEVKKIIQEKGFFYHQRPITEQVHHSYFVEGLGKVVRKDDIKLYVSKRNLHSPGALEFHTDSAETDLISWFCIEPGQVPQATNYLDTKPILQKFTTAELDLLTEAYMKCPTRDGTNQFPLKPLLTKSGRDYLVYYTPWFFVEPENPEIELLIRKFKHHVAEQAAVGSFGIALSQGESIIIDNKRMLHGRGALQADTSRFLRRTWISTQK